MDRSKDNSFDTLITPIVERQEKINLWILSQIAQKIKEIGKVLPSDVQKLIRLRNTGSDVREIKKKLAEFSKVQEKEITKMIEEVARVNYVQAKPFYDARHKPYIPFDKNTDLQRTVEAIKRQTNGTYKNIAKAQAFQIRDLKNPKRLIDTPLSQAYQSVVDEAIQVVQSGTVDYNTAMRRTMKQLVESGLRTVEYEAESGKKHTQRMDTAVRRNLLDGVRQVNQEVQNITGEQFGADGIELSVHQYPAPDHAPVQGHQFYKTEFEKMQNNQMFTDVQGRMYKPFKRAIGTLNCRHFAFNIIVGHAEQNYTDEELQEILDRNEKGYTTPNGKHMTMYECTQKQRWYESQIRKAKDGQIAARESGDMALAREYQAKVDKYTKQYKAFSKACGLSVKNTKLTVSGYHKIKAG